ncbi:hypothetical protein AWL63_05470 [Sphingomonas panacis]|uniref:Uncharacterized protein n=2 Tax=Sphingomonas panacis TaxID=1560345 RepID=A0A1B3Z7V1_9SPHN|nr:hypothetical protein AWL63_05470 [Sphingomonas panacis]
MTIIEVVNRAAFALYPSLVALDSADAGTLAKIVISMPISVRFFMMLGLLLGAFGGAWLGLRVCDRRLVLWIVVAAVIAVGLAGVLTLPHPVWMKVCVVVLPVLGGALAARVHRKPYPGEALLG